MQKTEFIDGGRYMHHTAPTQFVEAAGIRFAYRRFGKKMGIPQALGLPAVKHLSPFMRWPGMLRLLSMHLA